jgi:hypothetical protein
MPFNPNRLGSTQARPRFGALDDFRDEFVARPPMRALLR